MTNFNSVMVEVASEFYEMRGILREIASTHKRVIPDNLDEVAAILMLSVVERLKVY